MKIIAIIGLLAFISITSISCKKEQAIQYEDKNISEIKKMLKDSLNYEDFLKVDFNSVQQCELIDNSGHLVKLNIIDSDTNSSKQIFIKTDNNNKVVLTKILSLSGEIFIRNTLNFYNGKAIISDLKNKNIITYDIENGKMILNTEIRNNIKSLSNNNVIKKVNAGDGFNTPMDLTDVYVTNNLKRIIWMNGSIIVGGNPNEYVSVNETLEPGSDGSYDMIIQIDIDDPLQKLKIDLQKLIDCYGTITNEGAVYKVTINSDVPVDEHPNWVVYNVFGASAGHVFLTFTKISGGNQITQNFGFYPSENPPFSLNAPYIAVPSKLANDEYRDIDAQYSIYVSESQFNQGLQNAVSFGNNLYELFNYNCVDYAMNVFNSIGNGNHISTAGTSVMKNSPSALYQTINNIKLTGNLNAKLSPSNNKAGASNGPCN